MATRKKLETKVFGGLPEDTTRSVYVNKESLVSLAQYGGPAKIFPLFMLIKQNAATKEFDLPDQLPTLPIGEEVAQSPGLLDVGRWLDSIDCVEDAMFALQVGQTIWSRLPDSYKKKSEEVV